MKTQLPPIARRVAAIVGVSLIALGIPAAAQSNSLAMLGDLVEGEWTISYRDGSPARKICVRSGTEFIQLRHSESNCSRFVVEDGASKVAVQYTCPGNGYGRTNIRRETGSLVQIQSQGFVSGSPFEFEAEARRTGSC